MMNRVVLTMPTLGCPSLLSPWPNGDNKGRKRRGREREREGRRRREREDIGGGGVQVQVVALLFSPLDPPAPLRRADLRCPVRDLRRLRTVGMLRNPPNNVLLPAPAAQIKEVGVEYDLSGDPIAEDYYSILGVTPDATQREIKKAYYSCMKACHPDLSGESDETTDFCMFVNEIYEVLSDPVQRMVYDEINGYSLKSTNPFMDVKAPRDHVFVDEFTCIGCKNCANIASQTFEMEEEYGRARAACQRGDTPDRVQQAIDTCPVDCIYWVTAPQLSLLEDEMRRVERVNVGVMLSGMGSQGVDIFARASSRWQKRQARAVERATIRRMMEKSKNSTSPWWQDVLNKSSGEDGARSPAGDDLARERAAKAAAAARRWREYSRKGIDRKRPIYNLPETTEKELQESEMARK